MIREKVGPVVWRQSMQLHSSLLWVELKMAHFEIKMGVKASSVENVNNCFYGSQGYTISAFWLVHSHLLLNAGLSQQAREGCWVHSEQTGNDRLLCLLRGFLICRCEQGYISYHVKKLDGVWKFSGRSPRLKSLSNSWVEHFNYWPGLCLWPGGQSSSILHEVSLNLLLSADAPALWAQGPDVMIFSLVSFSRLVVGTRNGHVFLSAERFDTGVGVT